MTLNELREVARKYERATNHAQTERDNLEHAVIAAYKAGIRPHEIAAAIGVSRFTVHRWIRESEKQ